MSILLDRTSSLSHDSYWPIREEASLRHDFTVTFKISITNWFVDGIRRYVFPAIFHSVNLNIIYFKSNHKNSLCMIVDSPLSSGSSWSTGDDLCLSFDRSFMLVKLSMVWWPFLRTWKSSQADRCSESCIPFTTLIVTEVRGEERSNEWKVHCLIAAINDCWRLLFFPRLLLFNDTLSDVEDGI